MLPFKRNYLQHALAMSAWMTAHGVKAAQDPKTLGLEVDHGGKVVHFHPQFDVETPEGQHFVQNIGPSVVGFVGWFPYLPKAWPAAQSKLAFKAFARQVRLRTPAWSQNASDAKGLVLVKRNVSTFGEGQRGPFLMPAGQALAEPVAIDAGEYIEQFIVGQGQQQFIISKVTSLVGGADRLDNVFEDGDPFGAPRTIPQEITIPVSLLLANDTIDPAMVANRSMPSPHGPPCRQASASSLNCRPGRRGPSTSSHR